jgi:carboxymethylenebutenolidase
LRDLGKDVTMHIHPGTQHAFYNDTRPDVYDAEAFKVAWMRTMNAFAANL